MSKPLLTPDLHHRLLTVLREKAPEELDLGEALWTRDAVAEWAARELSVKRSRWVWGRWLAAKGFTPQKPARRAYERDPVAVDRWLKKEHPSNHLSFHARQFLDPPRGIPRRVRRMLAKCFFNRRPVRRQIAGTPLPAERPNALQTLRRVDPQGNWRRC